MSTSREHLVSQLAALDAALFPAPVQFRQFVQPAPPEDPTVTVPLRVALEAQAALYQYGALLEQAAAAATGNSNDVAMAYDRAARTKAALEALRPLVAAATEENSRRRAEWRARTRG